MSEARSEQGGEGHKIRRLSDAVRRVRIAEAERTDAFSDLHDAERARLGMLADHLAGVFDEIPPDDDYFLCQIGGGAPPRLWVDATTHVTIGRDRRTYRFLKDTRLGRVVLSETADLAGMADTVTDYIAERVVERERLQETDLLLARMRNAVLPRTERVEAAERAPAAEAASLRRAGVGKPVRGSTFVWLVIAFLFGIAAGAAGLIAYAWFKIPG